jgi:hypothetical protein
MEREWTTTTMLDISLSSTIVSFILHRKERHKQQTRRKFLSPFFFPLFFSSSRDNETDDQTGLSFSWINDTASLCHEQHAVHLLLQCFNDDAAKHWAL